MGENDLSNVVHVGDLGFGHFLDEVASIFRDSGSLRKVLAIMAVEDTKENDLQEN